MPNFQQSFVIEMNAMKTGIKAVLGQEGKPNVYLNKAIGERFMNNQIYEREPIAMVLVVQK